MMEVYRASCEEGGLIANVGDSSEDNDDGDSDAEDAAIVVGVVVVLAMCVVLAMWQWRRSGSATKRGVVEFKEDEMAETTESAKNDRPRRDSYADHVATEQARIET